MTAGYAKRSRGKSKSTSYGREKQETAKRWLSTVLIICVVTGFAAGAVKAYLMSESAAGSLLGQLNSYFAALTSGTERTDIAFIECMVKYSKYAVLIWFLAFIPPAAIGSCAVLFAKGISLGYTMGALVRIYGAQGVYTGVTLCLLQNIILVPAYISIAKSCLFYAMANSGSGKKSAVSIARSGFAEYFISLIFCLACMALASLFEVYILPKLASGIL